MKKYSDDELEKLFGELVFKQQLKAMRQTNQKTGFKALFFPAWKVAALFVLVLGTVLWLLLPSEKAIFEENLALLQYQATNAQRGAETKDEIPAIEKAFAEQHFEACTQMASEANSELLKIYVATAYLKLSPPKPKQTIRLLAQENEFPSYYAERFLLLGLSHWQEKNTAEAQKYFMLYAEAQGKNEWEKTLLRWKLTWAK